MATPKTNLTRKRTVILSALSLAVIASGFSQIEFHTHAAADLGHVHDVHDHADADGANPGDTDETGDSGAMHTHDIGAPALAPVPVIDMNLVVHRPAQGRTPPPTANPPDNPIIPLHRPPIV